MKRIRNKASNRKQSSNFIHWHHKNTCQSFEGSTASSVRPLEVSKYLTHRISISKALQTRSHLALQSSFPFTHVFCFHNNMLLKYHFQTYNHSMNICNPNLGNSSLVKNFLNSSLGSPLISQSFYISRKGQKRAQNPCIASSQYPLRGHLVQPGYPCQREAITIYMSLLTE